MMKMTINNFSATIFFSSRPKMSDRLSAFACPESTTPALPMRPTGTRTSSRSRSFSPRRTSRPGKRSPTVTRPTGVSICLTISRLFRIVFFSPGPSSAQLVRKSFIHFLTVPLVIFDLIKIAFLVNHFKDSNFVYLFLTVFPVLTFKFL